MSTYKQERKRLEELGEAAETATKAAGEIAAFFKRHPEVRDVLANYSAIYSYFNQDLPDISFETLEDCWLNHGKFRASLARYPSESFERDALETRILDLLKTGTSTENLKSIKTGFRYKSIEDLRAKVDDLEARAAMRAKTPQELRAEIQAARPGPETELPKDISKEQILHMWEPTTFRYWAKRLGSMEPITRRINEK
jgi:hypothetical protein